MDRRTFLLSSLVVGTAGVLSACTTGSTTAADPTPSDASAVDAGAFPVTIEHAFGSTTITSEPKRIVALGTNDSDNLLALGVLPVGVVKVSWGGTKAGSTPWFETKLKELDQQMPAQVDDSDSVPFEDIAALTPDLILVTNYGLTEGDYAKLAKIANVVAYPGAAWITTWQKSLELVGLAVGRKALAAQVEQQTQAVLDQVKKDHPQLAGKTFIWAAMSATDLSSIPYYTPQDARPLLLTEVGMQNAPVIEKLAKQGQFYGTVSAERAADLDSDLLITYADDPAAARTIMNDNLIGQIPAVSRGHVFAAVDQVQALSGTTPTPLAIPYAAQHWFPHVATALSSTVIS